MSFLAYILRGANESLRQYQDTIPHASVRLLQDCPPDATGIRKARFLSLVLKVSSNNNRSYWLQQGIYFPQISARLSFL